MSHPSLTRITRWLVPLFGMAMLAACQRPIDPVVPVGEAAYDAVTVERSAAPARYTLLPGDRIGVRVYGGKRAVC